VEYLGHEVAMVREMLGGFREQHHKNKAMFCCTSERLNKEFSQALQKLFHHFLMPQCQQWHPLTPLLLPTFPPLLQHPLHSPFTTQAACMSMNTPFMCVPIIKFTTLAYIHQARASFYTTTRQSPPPTLFGTKEHL
jgi:hypothetical protein